MQALEAYEERMIFFKEIKEEILYKKTIKKYVELLIGHYKKSKHFISDNNEILKCIRKKFKSVFFEYIINPEVLRIRKIKACIFYINSDLYDILFEK